MRDGAGCVHVQVVLRVYCRKEYASLALRVFNEMRNLGLVPDRVMKELLVKSLWKEGKLRDAAQVEEKCEDLAQELPMATPGHVWTVSLMDFKKVFDIYSGFFSNIHHQHD